MKLTTNLQPMLDRLDAAHRGAAADTLEDVRANQAVRTGELRDSFHTVEHVTSRGGGRRLKIYIVSSAIYADAVEHGAWTRAKTSVRNNTRRRRVKGEAVAGPLLWAANRRGPHMKGNGVVAENGPNFLEHMGYRLRGGNYSGRSSWR